ncbi:MAG: 30S ribosomal protein S17 [Candidatus Nealsonbacteria bacterium]
MMKRVLIGNIVSDKMKNTVVVQTERIIAHPKYKKRYKKHKKYHAEVKSGEYSVGDKVQIQECSPLSKTKKWEVVRKLNVAKEELNPDQESEL